MIKWINFIFILLLTGLCVYSQKLNADLLSLTSFGNNPGDLKAFHYQPEKPTDTLVVLLHGCGQDAKEFARYTGFLEAAEQKGFSLLIPATIAPELKLSGCKANKLLTKAPPAEKPAR